MIKKLLLLLLLTSTAFGQFWNNPTQKPWLGQQVDWSHPLSKGLVGYWLMNEDGGGKVFDLSGNGNTGTLEGDTHWVPGKFGSCLDFDGTGDYVNVPEVGNLSVVNSGSGYTASVWMKIPLVVANTNMAFVSKYAGSNYEYQFTGYFFTSGIVQFTSYNFTLVGGAAGGNMSWQSPSGFYPDKWIHVVWTIDGGAQSGGATKLYVDGLLKDSETLSDNMGNGTAPLVIGRRGTDMYVNGQIDNVKIYNRALSAAEIQQDFREPFCMIQEVFPVWWYGGIGGEAPAGVYLPYYYLSGAN